MHVRVLLMTDALCVKRAEQEIVKCAAPVADWLKALVLGQVPFPHGHVLSAFIVHAPKDIDAVVVCEHAAACPNDLCSSIEIMLHALGCGK